MSTSPRLVVKTKDASEPVLAPKVSLGFCDICAGGARGLLGLASAAGEECRQWALDWDLGGTQSDTEPQGRLGWTGGAAEASVASGAVEGPLPGPVKLVTFFDSSGQASRSVLVLTGGVPENKSVIAAAALIDFVEEHSSCEQIYVAAAVAFQTTKSGRQLSLNAATSTLEWPAWDPQSQVHDALLAALIHICTARGLKSLFIVAPGYRLESCTAANEDSQLKVAHQLGAAVSNVLGCRYVESITNSTCVESLWYEDKHQSLPIYT
mmetsp:Transcript_7044/g.8076  ORF Transcript_7044/g.8076 Transcript_7044/m.8076 type:complete len:266 (-) Transcript_7044:185-982(-)